ncbi:MAG: TonB-dependent receptor family protein, partial [Tannerella sp.]|nr:TonB-dependent receptor family protein [Tannerella sp.]
SGTISGDSGQFRLKAAPQAAMLKVSYMGYVDKVLPLRSGQSDLGNIKLLESAQVLGEVVVKGNLPVTRIKGEALETNIAGTVLEKAGTANDVLSKLPGVTSKEGQLNVFNRGMPTVYINGREVRDPEELNQLASDNIQSVQVITHPGARYAKSVKAVIRITTKKNPADGFGFSDRANGAYNRKWSYGDQLDLGYHHGKFDATGLLSYSDNGSWRNLTTAEKADLADYWDQHIHAKQNIDTRQVSARLALDYALNKDNSFGASYRLDAQPHNKGSEQHFATDLYRNNSLYEQSVSVLAIHHRMNTQEGDLYYAGQLGQWSLDFNGSYIYRTSHRRDRSDEEVTEAASGMVTPNVVHNYSRTAARLYAAKLVASYPLWKGKLSFGGEYDNTRRNNVYDNTEGLLPDDNSRVEEGLSAGFFEYGHTFAKLQLQAGLRFEHTGFDYYEDGVYQPGQSRKYDNWFPSLSLTLPIGKTEWQLSYASDIDRPVYGQLSNSIDYVNRYMYWQGNPFLLPAITNSLALTVTWQWLEVYADMEHNKDEIQTKDDTYAEDEPAITLEHPYNMQPFNAVNAELVASPVIGRWSPQFDLGFYKQWLSFDAPGAAEGEKIRLDDPSFQGTWRNSVNLPWGIVAGADLNAYSHTATDNITVKAYWWMDLSLYKDFLDHHLTLLLKGDDVFNTERQGMNAYYGRLRTTHFDQKYGTQAISLTVTYKFNQKKSRYKGTGAGAEQKERM